MMLGVLLMGTCLCLTIISLSGVAGLRDELSAVKTQAAGTRVAEVSTQYALGMNELGAENYAMAELRFEYIATEYPGYQDAEARLAQIQVVLSYTPTPSPTSSPLPPTASPSPTLEPGITSTPSPTLSGPDPAALFGQAETAITQQDYAAAIEWLDALVLVDRNYRRAEVDALRLNAYIAQGRLYLRGQNPDGQERLAQGVQLINRASELGTVPPDLLYEADFVARYLAARAYVQGGAYEQARPVLEQLCQEDCDWSYQGLSVRMLMGGISN
jgi:tetratricopeptide (TPR) repeat protein